MLLRTVPSAKNSFSAMSVVVRPRTIWRRMVSSCSANSAKMNPHLLNVGYLMEVPINDGTLADK